MSVLILHDDDQEGRWEYCIFLDINHLDALTGCFRLNMCVQSHSILSHGMQGYHLTSDPEYIEWLTKHGKSLPLISAENWYEDNSDYPRYYKEFHEILEKCQSFGQDPESQFSNHRSL